MPLILKTKAGSYLPVMRNQYCVPAVAPRQSRILLLESLPQIARRHTELTLSKGFEPG